MAENYSTELNDVLKISRDYADLLNSDLLSTQHLVIGMLEEVDSKAYSLLDSILEDKKDNLKQELKKSASLLKNSETESVESSNFFKMDKFCQMAFDKANFFEKNKFKDTELNSVLLLLGVLRNEKDTTVVVLKKYSIDYQIIEDRYVTKLGASKDYQISSLEQQFTEVEQQFTDLEKASEEDSIFGINGGLSDKSSNLDKYCKDLTELARKGKLEKVIGREKEIERVAQILCRKKKNNPILIGEPGVGKSAIVEGIAMGIVDGTVPSSLLNKRVVTLDLGILVAGTKYRGQFEERITAIMSELENSKDTIVFIDEIHNIVGAGNSSGSMDFSNMFKPALSRGDIQCIGATTLNEYRESIEKDGALERRFQKVIVNPTTKEQTVEILKNIKGLYEKHHNVIYTQEAIEACVNLTDRYVTDRFFPDKAVDALDEAGARARINKTEGESLEPVSIDADNIADVVSMISGVPVSKIGEREKDKLKNLKSNIEENVIGQNDAVESVVRSIKRNRTGLKDPNRPIGSFLFLGQTGVGKTQLAKVLARELFDDKDSMIRIDMSEYMEKFSVSRLIGSPPGYVGYEEGGQLTEKVRRKPYCVVLLDEIEKAHPDVFNILLQVLDDGFITDSLGRKIDFKNTIIIMTSNIGARQVKDFGGGIGYGTTAKNSQSDDNKKSIIENSLKRVFAPEFLNRIDEIVMFNALGKEDIFKIVDIELKKLSLRMKSMGYELEVSESAKKFVSEKGFDKNYGARPLKRAIQQYVEDELAEKIVNDQIEEGSVVRIDYREGEDKLSISFGDKFVEIA